mmetsp:Transcript_17900/g.40576  ORF Transcript_17900/g.40576 Transcript_17900/m.40576 type:complete len:207 (-) Transcript_17900:480-1100(-)
MQWRIVESVLGARDVRRRRLMHVHVGMDRFGMRERMSRTTASLLRAWNVRRDQHHRLQVGLLPGHSHLSSALQLSDWNPRHDLLLLRNRLLPVRLQRSEPAKPDLFGVSECGGDISSVWSVEVLLRFGPTDRLHPSARNDGRFVGWEHLAGVSRGCEARRFYFRWLKHFFHGHRSANKSNPDNSYCDKHPHPSDLTADSSSRQRGS